MSLLHWYVNQYPLHDIHFTQLTTHRLTRNLTKPSMSICPPDEVWDSHHYFFAHAKCIILGAVALFIPRNFSGVIQLTTRRGSMELMPGLLKIAKIVNETETETLLMIANPRIATSSSTANYCQLYSRFGKLYVGVKGEDKLLPREPGKWAKFAQYLGVHMNPSSVSINSSHGSAS